MLRPLRLAAVVLLFSPAIFAQGEKPRLPIIDMHLHAYPSPAFGEPNPNPVTGQDPGIKDEAAHMRATLDAMKRYNIVKGFVSGPIAVVHRWHDAYPDRIVAGPYFEGTKAIMRAYPQVYADLAIIDWNLPREEFHEALHSLVRAGLGKRLMFGTDQIFWPEAIGMAVDGIESATFLTPEQKRDIFYNNAVRFLNLTN